MTQMGAEPARRDPRTLGRPLSWERTLPEPTEIGGRGRARADLPAPNGRSVFLYVARGQINVSGISVKPWHLITLND
jgi:redox-sensitive bicupin YhaK (pirin superfamily)